MPLDHASVRSLTGLMGPWFVLNEQVPTGPGVSWSRFLSLTKKGKVTSATLVRGPATEGLWMPAGRVPLVATQLGLCWSCQAPLPPGSHLAECPKCGRGLNGPTNWPDPLPAASGGLWAAEPLRDDADGRSPIDELIEAGTASRRGKRSARHPARSGRGGLVLLLLAGGLVGGGAMFAAMMMFAPNSPAPPASPQRGTPDPAPSSDLDPAPWSRPDPPTATGDGELFPEVPAGTRIRPATATLPEQRRTAQERFDQARRCFQAGDLMAAQDILVSLVNSHSTEALPKGTRELLDDVRRRILATRPAGPSKEEAAK